MVTGQISMTDIGRQKRFETELGGRLTPNHTVQQAIEQYLESMKIRDNGLRWTAFSRGVRLDSKRRLSDLEETDAEWTVLPEVSAGGR